MGKHWSKSPFKPVPPDVRRVIDAAGLLQIGEFQLFEHAYQRWFGNIPDSRQIERCHVQYMFHGVVPLWVRHFCRSVQRDADAGTLYAENYGIARPRDRYAGYSPYTRAIIVFLVLTQMLFAAGLVYALYRG